jgi:hypothetical protein
MAKKRSKKTQASRTPTKKWTWFPLVGIGALALYCYWNAQSDELPVVSGPDYPKREAIANHRELSHYTVYHRLNRQRTPGLPPAAKASDPSTGSARLLPPEEVPQWSSGDESSSPADTASSTQSAPPGTEGGTSKTPVKKNPNSPLSPASSATSSAAASAASPQVNPKATETARLKPSTKKETPLKKPKTVSGATTKGAPMDPRTGKNANKTGAVVHVIGVYPTKEKAVAVYKAWQASANKHVSPFQPKIQNGKHKGRSLYRVVMTGPDSPALVQSWMRRLRPSGS